MLDKFTQFIERHLAGPMEKLGSQRHLRAVRDGIVSTLPLIIVSSFFYDFSFSSPATRLGNLSISFEPCDHDLASLPHDDVHYEFICRIRDRL